MTSVPTWISGPVRSGKTTALIQHLVDWSHASSITGGESVSPAVKTALVFAVNADNRQGLMPAIAQATTGKIIVQSTTPLGFFEDEVMLFWPLVLKALGLQAQFPLRLRPETEQALAAQFWHTAPWEELQDLENMSPDRWVRRILDLLQLAAFGGIALEDLPRCLEDGLGDLKCDRTLTETLAQMLMDWRDWCLQQGLLTYGILTALYWRYLLPDPAYQGHLLQRYQGVFADDVDSYPAITRDLFEVWLDHGQVGVFSFNPDGAIRLGLGADPEYLGGLQDVCQLQSQHPDFTLSLGAVMGQNIVAFVSGETFELPEPLTCLQTSSRAQLLRQTADQIIDAIQSGQVQPEEIAVIGPGLDTIARYTLIEILTAQGIPVESLKDQRPLNSAALIRALLTLLTLVYPGLGRLVDAEQIAEMLVVLTHQHSPSLVSAAGTIDPVRAGLLADYCFHPHPEHPQLLPVEDFPRWDRLGHQATTAYNNLLSWLDQQHKGAAPTVRQPYLTLNPVFILDRAIQEFLAPHALNYDQLSVLRELMETAQHYWQVDERLRQTQTRHPPLPETVGQFIQLLRQGTLTANPFPVNPNGQPRRAVMLATTFQYRMARPAHRWHFWLDAGSALWHGGGAVILWGAPFCLRHWSGEPLTVEDEMKNDQAQLRRLLLDLLSRVTEKVFLCHSDLSVSGQEQVGPLLPLVDASTPLIDNDSQVQIEGVDAVHSDVIQV
ncbi:recombinase family protein [Acaryochloris sp. IP29b_bin.148]|uniref:recombinase family protein n=1 Tax=Acaryochloris sp. IP29b_bin.148 TaxID=2969218 RepID=UPI0026373028|nr:recombinase family protein [Acaryochloris sp. IP29b_bin.148]